MFIRQRNTVIRENQEMALPPATVFNQPKNSGGLESAQCCLLKLFEHQTINFPCATVSPMDALELLAVGEQDWKGQVGAYGKGL